MLLESASAFQDIISQIIKNLDYAHPLSNRTPKDVDKWDEDWKLKEVTRKRIIKGDKEANEIWNLIKQYQRDPETVIIYGRCHWKNVFFGNIQ